MFCVEWILMMIHFEEEPTLEALFQELEISK